MSAWYGDENAVYTYSGIRNEPLPWTDALLECRQKLGEVTDEIFNSVLLNQYVDGHHGMGWHSDDEPELGHNPLICSLSLGETRCFSMRHKFDKSQRGIKLPLSHGSLLIMEGQTQKNWQHSVPKTRRTVGCRINLTFRNIDVI